MVNFYSFSQCEQFLLPFLEKWKQLSVSFDNIDNIDTAHVIKEAQFTTSRTSGTTYALSLLIL